MRRTLGPSACLSPGGWCVQVNVRQCITGEIYTDTRCVVCPVATFTFDARPADSLCRDCPGGARCLGASMLVPRAGRYHTSLISENFPECVIVLCYASPRAAGGLDHPSMARAFRNSVTMPCAMPSPCRMRAGVRTRPRVTTPAAPRHSRRSHEASRVTLTAQAPPPPPRARGRPRRAACMARLPPACVQTPTRQLTLPWKTHGWRGTRSAAPATAGPSAPPARLATARARSRSRAYRAPSRARPFGCCFLAFWG